MSRVSGSLPGPVEVIDMNQREAKCSLCGKWTDACWGVPTYNGDLVSNDFPDWLTREGGGCMAACEACYEKHARGEVLMFDHYYLHLSGGFMMGDGI